MPFLPISKQDMKDRGIDQLDFICITGDAYVDHPSFGIAIISRMLESCGCNVGIIAQPVTDEDFKKLGEPKYCFLVTGGNIDSMVSNYTVFKKKRWDDAYSEGGKGGKRPDRAVTVYCKTLTRLFPDKEIAIGGLEASLRRFAHYDYWADKVMPSILVDSGSKLLMYGMGELTIVQLYRELAEGKKLSEIHDIRGTCYLTEPKNTPLGAVQCDSFEIVSENKKAYAKSCRQQYDEQDEVYGKTMVQRHGNMMLVQNPPQRSLTQSEFDKAYELPYMKAYHPCYEKGGGVPGINVCRARCLPAHNCRDCTAPMTCFPRYWTLRACPTPKHTCQATVLRSFCAARQNRPPRGKTVRAWWFMMNTVRCVRCAAHAGNISAAGLPGRTNYMIFWMTRTSAKIWLTKLTGRWYTVYRSAWITGSRATAVLRPTVVLRGSQVRGS